MLKRNKNNKLSFFAFFTMTAIMIISLPSFPTFATAKANLIFYLVICGVFWFLPVALCAAEMATVKKWPNSSIYNWVERTLGKKLGFAAIFYQWIQVTVGFITMIYFVIGSIAYSFDLYIIEQNQLIKFIIATILFIVLTITQLKGTKTTTSITKAGIILGVIVPFLLVFVLLIIYLVQGHQSHIQISPSTVVPDLSTVLTLVIFASFVDSYAGAEASAPYINELENPQRNYPLVMLTLVIFIVVLNTFGGLAVAMVVPQNEISLSYGFLQSFQMLIDTIIPGNDWLIKVVGLLISFGVLGEISSWIVGPTQTMYFAAKAGRLPKIFKKTNKAKVPINLLILQVVIVTAWTALLTLGSGSSNLSFMISIQLSINIYLAAYTLFFIAYLILNLKQADLERTYKVSKYKIIRILTALSGLFISLVALVLSFTPPSSLPSNQQSIYLLIMAVSFSITIIAPFIIYLIQASRKELKELEGFIFKNAKINPYVDPRARNMHELAQIDNENINML